MIIMANPTQMILEINESVETSNSYLLLKHNTANAIRVAIKLRIMETFKNEPYFFMI